MQTRSESEAIIYLVTYIRHSVAESHAMCILYTAVRIWPSIAHIVP